MSKITIIGLGPGRKEDLTLEAYKILSKKEVILRTKIHPVIEELQKEGIDFYSFDNLYEKSASYDELYESIVNDIIKKAHDHNVYYAVPGNPFFAENTVQLLLKKAQEENIELEFIPSISFIDVVAQALKKDLGENTAIIDSYKLLESNFIPDVQSALLIVQVFNSFMLSEVKLKLQEFYPDETPVTIVYHAGLKDQNLKEVPLYLLDREKADHLTSLFIDPQKELLNQFNKLVEITKTLRMPGGCPWDREQTHESLKRYFLEETGEVLEAIDEKDFNHLKEELGDVLFQVMIHSQIADEENYFNIFDVINDINKKMIRRHPHVFGNVKANTSNEVLVNWDEIKKKEKGAAQKISDEMKQIPKYLSQLIIADKIQRKARKVGFDWDEAKKALEKVDEESIEVKEELNRPEINKESLMEEIGDLLFASVNVARLSGIDPEEALNQANKKFIKRFESMEKLADLQNQNMEEMDLDSLENLWILAKQE